MTGPVPWETAWQHALYGADGFYRGSAGPAGHFTTASHGPLGAVLAEALLTLAERHGLTRVVDVGAGRGELLSAMARAETDGRALLGVDVVERPVGLDVRIDWLEAPGGAALPDALRDLDGTLVVANEWLDVVPCPIAEVGDDGTLRTVLVDPATGEERLADPLGDADATWAATWWPPPDGGRRPGDRIEVGRTRDVAWADLLARLGSGIAVAIDYGHRRADRPRDGTLMAYRTGTPLPAGEGLADADRNRRSTDLTAHVAVDSLAHDRLVRQRDALDELGVTGGHPPRALAGTEPRAYLDALQRASAIGELRRAGGLGDFWWVVVERFG